MPTYTCRISHTITTSARDAQSQWWIPPGDVFLLATLIFKPLSIAKQPLFVFQGKARLLALVCAPRYTVARVSRSTRPYEYKVYLSTYVAAGASQNFAHLSTFLLAVFAALASAIFSARLFSAGLAASSSSSSPNRSSSSSSSSSTFAAGAAGAAYGRGDAEKRRSGEAGRGEREGF